jgi:hypothetical protein
MSTPPSEQTSLRSENSYTFNYDNDSGDDGSETQNDNDLSDALTESLNNLQSVILEYNTIVNQVISKKDSLNRTLHNDSRADSNSIVAIPDIGTSVGEQRSEESSVDVRLPAYGTNGSLSGETTEEFRKMKAYRELLDDSITILSSIIPQ